MRRLLHKRRPSGLRWLIGAYFFLALLGAFDSLFGPVHIGVLAVIPLLVIGFFGRRGLAFVTAVICAAGFAALDNDLVHPAVRVNWNIEADATLFAIIYIAILLTAERLRASESAAASDVLTSLPNRRTVERRIDDALRRARHNHGRIALLFVDLDNFKGINDRFGHSVGDRFLKHASERLVHAVRAADTVGRVGGDEFVVVLEDVSDAAQPERVAATIESVLAEPFSDENAVQKIGATVGVSMFPGDGTDAASLLRLADTRMYARKRAKRGEVQV